MKPRIAAALAILFCVLVWALFAWGLRSALAQQPLVAAIIGDYGTGATIETRVANRVHSWNPDLVLTVGDNNYPSGARSTINKNIVRDYGRYISPDPTENRFYPSLGNHDYGTRRATPYIEFFALPGNERWYSLSRGGVTFWIVDSVKYSSEQRDWLQSGIGASEACFDVVLFHHPPFSSGKHGGNVMMQEDWPAWGAELIITGHDHDYERLEVDGLTYIVNGLGGKKPRAWGQIDPRSIFRYRDDNGALRLTVDGGVLTTEFITDDGVVIDTYRMERNCS